MRAASDHCPIMLDTNDFKWGPTPFRFENMWTRDKNYKEKFKEWWRKGDVQGWEGHKFMKRLEQVKKEIKLWNKESFGDVRLAKNAVLKRISELDEKERKNSLVEMERIERREWDNNSKLFHRIASKRKANKLINKIENVRGEILQSEKEIEEDIVGFFEKLYNEERRESVGIEGLEWACIRDESGERLEKPFEEEEVKNALFQCDGDKAPGPDGFTMKALQDGWETIKKDIMGVFREFYNYGVVNT